MKRWWIAWVALLGLASAAMADPLGMLADRWKWWESPRIRKEVGLTDAQVEKIRNLVRSRREEMIDLKAVLEKRALVLSDEVEREDFDLQSAISAAEDFQMARSQLEKARLRLILEIRQVLTKDQFLRLRALRKETRRRILERRAQRPRFTEPSEMR